jgi:Fe-S cluster assembly protein SufD
MEPNWLTELRKKSCSEFARLALPSERDEAWRYTDLSPMNMKMQASDGSSVTIESSNDNIIAQNFAAALENHSDFMEKHFSKLFGANDKINAFHFSSFSDGIFVFVPKNEEGHVTVSFEDCNAHSIIVLEEGAKLTYSEELLGKSDALLTDGTEIFAGENSELTFNSIQDLGKDTKAFSIKAAELKRNANLDWNFFSMGSRFYRLHSSIFFTGEGSNARTSSAFLVKDEQHMDITTNAFHRVPNTTSNMLAKGVLLSKSKAVYRGKIRIDPGAQKTNSYLSDHMLIVGSEAIANSIPGLEIEANDVKASHGSTKGQINEEQLFYLESRGIPRKKAENLIISGFLMPIVNKLQNDAIKNKIKMALGADA